MSMLVEAALCNELNMHISRRCCLVVLLPASCFLLVAITKYYYEGKNGIFTVSLRPEKASSEEIVEQANGLPTRKIKSMNNEKKNTTEEEVTMRQREHGDRQISNVETDKVKEKKLILLIMKAGEVPFGRYFARYINFNNCEFSNCIYKYNTDKADIDKAAVILLMFKSALLGEYYKLRHGSTQIWLAYSHESPAYSFNQWKSIINDFNGTLAYRRDSTIGFPWGETLPLTSEQKNNLPASEINYAKGKTKGAFVYISNCGSQNYNRLATIKQLKQYVHVDIFGACTGNIPCTRQQSENTDCETRLHATYRFHIAFENSLCKDYITEKFWSGFRLPGYFVPVALGGTSLEDYTEVAPPNSFVHAYNFSSIEKLGRYLQHLMDDDEAYNKYHEWRQNYYVPPESVPLNFSCDLCTLANKPETLQATQSKKLANEWNDGKNCKNLQWGVS